MTIDNTVPILTVTIALLAFLVSFASFWSSSKKSEGEDKATTARVMTKLEFIADDLKDIKAEYRSTRNELREVRDIAEHANERAEAAHKRLDRAKVDIKEVEHEKE